MQHRDSTLNMALEARSPNVAMARTPLSHAQTARLLAAECHRLKSEESFFFDKYNILRKLRDVELFSDSSTILGSRYWELQGTIDQAILKKNKLAAQLFRLGGGFGGPALSQASLSVLGTVNIFERGCITRVLEPHDLKDGAVLIKQGDPRDAFFIIVQGQVSCTRRDHRCKVAPARAALLERLGTPAPRRLGTPAPSHLVTPWPRCSARQGCASRRETQSATRAPGASRL